MKHLILIIGLLVFAPACAQNPPPGTYSAQGLKAFHADQFLKDLQALSDTAINLNAQTGALKLSDQNTRYVRDFVLTAAAATQAYANNGSPLTVVSTSFAQLTASLSAEAKSNPTLAKVLAIVAAGVNTLPTQ